MSLYVVSDLHGYSDLFEKGLETIGFSASDFLYVIGDAIDRGPDSIKILQTIKDTPNMDLLLGNHEFMMLNSVDPNGKPICDGRDSTIWKLANGGDVTYGKYLMLSENERKDLLSWLRRRLLIKTIELSGTQICLTHSYYKKDFENIPYCDISYPDAFNIVWTSIYRDDYYTHGMDIYKDYEYIFITGHVPVIRVKRWYEGDIHYNSLDIHKNGNLIDIDGGLSAGRDPKINNGVLFLRLEDMEVFGIPLV